MCATLRAFEGTIWYKPRRALLSLSRECITHIFDMREIGLDDFERYQNAQGRSRLDLWSHRVIAEVQLLLAVCGLTPGSWFLCTPSATCSGTAEGMEITGPAAAVPGYVQCALLSFLVWF